MLAEVVRLTLNHGGCVTRVSQHSADAVAIIDAWQPHLALADLDITDDLTMDRLRGAATGASPTPTIALTRRGELKTALTALERGVDDMLSIPFSPDELVARSLAVMRRSHPGMGALAPVIRLGDLEIDILTQVVRAGDVELRLTSIEQALLYFLVACAGRVVSCQEILDNLWGDYGTTSDVVDQHIRVLRTKLQDGRLVPRFIASVDGAGYRFVPTCTEVQVSGTVRHEWAVVETEGDVQVEGGTEPSRPRRP